MLIFLQVSCRPGRELVAQSMSGQPRIGFLAFGMKQAAGTSSSIILLDYRQVPGAMKPGAEPDYAEPDRLTVLLYRNGQLLDSQRVPHPLIRQAEHPAESGAFVSRRVQLDSAEFFIRFQGGTSPDEVRILDYRFNESVRPLSPIYLPSL